MEVKRKSLNYRRDKWLCAALAALPLLASSLLLSCKDGEEEIASSSGDGEASVSVHISVGEIGDLNATRANTNTTVSSAPEDGELINTLCVFIVDSNNKIEMKIQPDLSGTEADGGNLEEYRSDIEILSAGTKTIYAFANWETVDDNGWKAIIAKSVGDEIGDLQILIDDPASKVDIANHKYIPMSGKATVTVTENYSYTQTISVKLTRLVGKVWVKAKLYDDQNSSTENTLTVKGLTFSGTADKVRLFDDITVEGTISLNKEIKINSSMATDPIAEGDSADVAKFYVNESDRSGETAPKGFEVALNIDSYGGYGENPYSYTTYVTNIPRNNIYVFTLALDRYVLKPEATALTSILGVDGEVAYTVPGVQSTNGTYMLYLDDVTTQFTLSAEIVDTQTLTNYEPTRIPYAVTWAWKYTGTDTEEKDETATDKLTVSQLTATDHTYPYTLTAEWTENGISHSRTYDIEVDLSNSPTAPTLKSPAKQGRQEPAMTIRKKTESL